ncbi:hypothetical protein, partial [Pseudomonas viridiflava]|uniref:hypothetical protein n=1 Tax=Pseudomonas viridiflava TaxID=33069 RepID=UPI0019CF8436
SPWSQQDSGITLSTSMGMIGVLEITLIVPTLRAHRYTQVIWLSSETAALPCFFCAIVRTPPIATWVKAESWR